jgi:hypothetical protein
MGYEWTYDVVFRNSSDFLVSIPDRGKCGTLPQNISARFVGAIKKEARNNGLGKNNDSGTVDTKWSPFTPSWWSTFTPPLTLGSAGVGYS